MASTRFAPPGHPPTPQGLPDRRPWRHSLGQLPGADHCVRVSVFVAGLVVVLGGAALWMFSMLLTAPLVLAGLWLWSWEFVWARRLLHNFRIWLGRFLRRVKRRPVRWALTSALGLLSGAAAYWAWLEFGPW